MRRNVSAVSEFLPPSRTDRFRSVGLVLVLLQSVQYVAPFIYMVF